MYVTGETFETPFDISSIPIVPREQADAEDRNLKMRSSQMPTLKAPSTSAARPSAGPSAAEAASSAAAAAQKYASQLATVPELKPYGALLKSSSEVELTESETEYVVTAIKHVFKEHLVLQFNVKNTLPETVLEDVSMITTPSEDEDVELEEDFIIPAAKLASDEPGVIYVSFKRTGEETNYATTSFTNVLKFTSKEIDPSSGKAEAEGYEDEYQVEDLELTGGDYILPAFAGSFDNIWEQVGAAGQEAVETYSLGTAVKGIQGTLYTIFYCILFLQLTADG
jgi:coatomer protein complex subunit gamma